MGAWQSKLPVKESTCCTQNLTAKLAYALKNFRLAGYASGLNTSVECRMVAGQAGTTNKEEGPASSTCVHARCCLLPCPACVCVCVPVILPKLTHFATSNGNWLQSQSASVSLWDLHGLHTHSHTHTHTGEHMHRQ